MWKDKDKPAEAEKKYINELITRVVNRTAIFRIAIATTVIGVFGAALFTLAMIDLKRHQIPEQTPGHDQPPVQTGATIKYEIVNPQDNVAGRLSHSHTFLLNKETGELWQMTCRKGKKTVEFLVVPRRAEEQLSDGLNH
jgi:hypothetical protein